MCSDYNEIRIVIPNVQCQRRGKDCSLFALAYAMSVCLGENPSILSYIQHKKRPHLLSCLENRKITCFPTRSRARVHVELPKDEIFCSCRQPGLGNGLADCISCKTWNHKECETIPNKVWVDKNLVSLCTNYNKL